MNAKFLKSYVMTKLKKSFLRNLANMHPEHITQKQQMSTRNLKIFSNFGNNLQKRKNIENIGTGASIDI
jgi:hypothetical protein